MPASRSIRAHRNSALVVVAATLLVSGLSTVSMSLLTTQVASAATPCGTSGAYTTAGGVDTCTYGTAGEDEFTVPIEVSQVAVVAIGGAGEAGGSNGQPGGVGGAGGEVSATLSVSGGSTLYVEVGTDGSPGTSGASCAAGDGGANGGGDGGAAYCSHSGGGGGGGASDVRTTPASDGGLTGGAGDPRLVVAGGGGGGGGATGSPGGAGGAAGDGSVTGAGAGGDCSSGGPPNPGGPGGVGAGGGAGGVGVGPCGAVIDNVAAGGNGEPTGGGVGGDGAAVLAEGGGGGGGGFIGGGGGAATGTPQIGSGGGGGSSFGPAGAIVSTSSSAPSIAISWTLGLASFTTAGCSAWSVPYGVTGVQVHAIGAAGAAGSAYDGQSGGEGGSGDETYAGLSGLSSSEALDICVDYGGGSSGGVGGGGGGGASGVSLGSSFASPVVVAAGGGGGGEAGINEDLGGGGNGGNAGSPDGQTGGTAPGYSGGLEPPTTGGTGGTQISIGTAGSPGFATNGGVSSSSGPGIGGTGGAGYNGGGGGAGYNGGGGGGGGEAGGGGGGGGSDFCSSVTNVTTCGVDAGIGTGTGAGTAAGDAQVTITYNVLAAPSLTTSPNGSSVDIGTTLQDRATLSNNNTLDGTGSITFSLYGPSDPTCSSTPLDTETVTDVAGAGPWGTTTGLEAQATGTYNWTATFSGDGNNLGASEGCGQESVTVGKATLPISTVVDDAASGRRWGGTEGAGAKAVDTAALPAYVLGAPLPSGSVTYSFFDRFTCSGAPASTDSVSLSSEVPPGGSQPVPVVPDSATTPPLSVGGYAFQASYSGNPNYGSTVGPCERFHVFPLNVLEVAPDQGPPAGGTAITITGTGFAPGAIVRIGQGHGAGLGSLLAIHVTVLSSGEITAVTPKDKKSGPWNVFVIQPGHGQSPPHPADRFTYT